jgi:hypothetical protein
MRIDGQCAVDQAQQRVTVGRGAGDLTGRDPTVSGGLVLDNHGLAHRLRQPLRDRAGNQVARAASSGGDDEMNRFGGIEILGADRHRTQTQRDARN